MLGELELVRGVGVVGDLCWASSYIFMIVGSDLLDLACLLSSILDSPPAIS